MEQADSPITIFGEEVRATVIPANWLENLIGKMRTDHPQTEISCVSKFNRCR